MIGRERERERERYRQIQDLVIILLVLLLSFHPFPTRRRAEQQHRTNNGNLGRESEISGGDSAIHRKHCQGTKYRSSAVQHPDHPLPHSSVG